MPVILHHVAFSPSRGIYLGAKDGKVRFGKDSGVQVGDLAPTFHDKEAFEKHKAEFVRDQPFPDDVQLCEVWPDKPGEEASVDAVGLAGLPRWPAPTFKTA